MAETKLRTIT